MLKSDNLSSRETAQCTRLSGPPDYLIALTGPWNLRDRARLQLEGRSASVGRGDQQEGRR